MDDLPDEEARELLRQARAHMNPTVFDRARVARKLEAARLVWDGHHSVHGESLPDPSTHANPMAATVASTSKLGALKLAFTLTAAFLVGDAFVGSRVTQVGPTRTAPVVESPDLTSKMPRDHAGTPLVPAPVSAPARGMRVLEGVPQRAPTDAAQVARKTKPARSHAHTKRAAIEEPAKAGATPRRPLRPEPRVVGDPLSIDIALLRQAAQALYAGRARRALVLLNEHANRFSNSETRHERHALTFQAACALGQPETAELHRQVLLREASGSALAARVQDGCIRGSAE